MVIVLMINYITFFIFRFYLNISGFVIDRNNCLLTLSFSSSLLLIIIFNDRLALIIGLNSINNYYINLI